MRWRKFAHPREEAPAQGRNLLAVAVMDLRTEMSWLLSNLEDRRELIRIRMSVLERQRRVFSVRQRLVRLEAAWRLDFARLSVQRGTSGASNDGGDDGFEQMRDEIEQAEDNRGGGATELAVAPAATAAASPLTGSGSSCDDHLSQLEVAAGPAAGVSSAAAEHVFEGTQPDPAAVATALDMALWKAPVDEMEEMEEAYAESDAPLSAELSLIHISEPTRPY